MLDPLGRERTGQVSHLVGRGDAGCLGELENLLIDLAHTPRLIIRCGFSTNMGVLMLLIGSFPNQG